MVGSNNLSNWGGSTWNAFPHGSLLWSSDPNLPLAGCASALLFIEIGNVSVNSYSCQVLNYGFEIEDFKGRGQGPVGYGIFGQIRHLKF